MFEQLLMQNATVEMGWAFIASILVAAGTIIPIVRYWVKKAQDSSVTKEDADAILGKVLNVLDEGQKFVDATKNQETKIKQIGEVVFDSLPDKGASIHDKYAIKLANLQNDIDKAVKGTQVYDAKVKELERLLDELGIKSQ